MKQWNTLEKTQENFSLKFNNYSKGRILTFGDRLDVLHFNCHSFANAPKKITGTVFRKNTYASQLAPVIFFPKLCYIIEYYSSLQSFYIVFLVFAMKL